MARILVLQHVAHEILGTLDPLLRSYGARMRYVNFERAPDTSPTLDGYQGLIVLGGPMNVDQVERYPHLEREIRLIANAIERKLPVLGICLGAQLIARALGARVSPHAVKEIGWYEVTPTSAAREDPVLGAFGPNETVFQWHGDTFELPRGAETLVTGADCVQQAFRFGSHVYGLQFHLEVDAPMIEHWLNVPQNRDEIAATDGAIDPATIRRATPNHVGRLEQLSEKCFSGFVELIGGLRRRDRRPHH